MSERQRFIILRTPAARPTRGPAGVTRGQRSAGGPAATKLSIEVDEIDPRQTAQLSRSSDVQCIARSIPMKLIAPVATKQTASPSQGIAWGVKAVAADTSPFSGNGITVAVLDTGIDASHPAFSGVDLVQKDFTGEGNGDQNGHGTHCAGTIFGRDVTGTRIGVAPGVKRALIGKVLGTNGGSSDQIARGINWAVDNGANVISMSIGIDFPGYVAELQEEDGLPPELATTRALEGYRTNIQLFEGIAKVVRAMGSFAQATVISAAAGNESKRERTPPFAVAVSPPAVAEGIVSVGAVGETNDGFVVAPFSNTGAILCGPGVDVVSARASGGLTAMSGTSMATPHVAGVAALWAEKMQQTRSLTSVQLNARLIGSAQTDGIASGFDPGDVGAGLVQAPQK
jgi:subtilisin family serine protease